MTNSQIERFLDLFERFVVSQENQSVDRQWGWQDGWNPLPTKRWWRMDPPYGPTKDNDEETDK